MTNNNNNAMCFYRFTYLAVNNFTDSLIIYALPVDIMSVIRKTIFLEMH